MSDDDEMPTGEKLFYAAVIVLVLKGLLDLSNAADRAKVQAELDRVRQPKKRTVLDAIGSLFSDP